MFAEELEGAEVYIGIEFSQDITQAIGVFSTSEKAYVALSERTGLSVRDLKNSRSWKEDYWIHTPSFENGALYSVEKMVIE